MRKFYRPGSDEAQFDLTPATEKAIAWLAQLSERQFVGTESRLLTLFDLLKQMREGSEADPAKRLAKLHKKRDEIDSEIARVVSGDVPLLDDTAVKDRFQQFMQGARELLTDFREVEHNFRQLDRRVRERIALWDGGKGALLEQIMGERDAIADSDQGKSFRAFWDFLLSTRRQEELTELLDRVLQLPAVADLKPDVRTRRVHYDWMEAGEHRQRPSVGLPGIDCPDITLDADSFSRLQLAVQRVFITENEINFLAFPSVKDAIVIFGAGYGWDALARSRWLNDCT